MLHTKFQGLQPFLFLIRFLKVLTIYGHGGHLGRDLDHLNNILFNHPMEVPHEIWLQLAQWFLSRCLKLLKTE